VRVYAGRGYGHNVGMCQYGVQGMAREGKNFRDILRFYYPGVEIRDLY
jgi:stage II sporulation protein D